MDCKALGEETIDLLRRYLTVDTTNPPGRETDGARFLAGVLGQDGIASGTAEPAEDDERRSLKNIREGVRADTEMLRAAAA